MLAPDLTQHLLLLDRQQQLCVTFGFGPPTLMELGIHDHSNLDTKVIDCWLGREFGECLCAPCLYWQTRYALHQRQGNDPRLLGSCCAPDSLARYQSRHTDVLCLIKSRIRREFPDDDWSESEEDEEEEEEEPHELYVQLEHERAHARNMQPQLRWEQYWTTNGGVAQDPDSVICWF